MGNLCTSPKEEDVLTILKHKSEETTSPIPHTISPKHKLSIFFSPQTPPHEEEEEEEEVFRPPEWMMVGRRFKKHHRSTFGFLSSPGRGFRLTHENNFEWFKTSRVEGILEVGETRCKPDGMLDVCDIQGVESGFRTSVFKKSGVEGKEGCCFSILTFERTLDFEAESEEICRQWVQALEKYLELSLKQVKVLSDAEEVASAKPANRVFVFMEKIVLSIL
ncbi:hypothetical protein TrRE_jg1505 [Triparma retinervis]|uniref:PH domain-containing protein n=1 Tax=Triparma retinervis TaxID=2557542 RepID=A0A9W7E5P4_9STRA|nr:hypothetical protein TrRE_jg1505 [Triparma retinervis]